jgi:hypothetical protein
MFLNGSTFSLDMTKSNIDLFGIYLLLGDKYAIFAISTIIITQSKILQFVFFLMSLLILYILMSRTSLYVFFTTIAIYLFIKNKKQFITYSIMLAGVVFMAFVFKPIIAEDAISSRMFAFLFGNADLSMDNRSEYLWAGILGIENHWFIGDFGGEAIFYGKTGTYIHSYLGLLRQYGITAFIIFIMLPISLLKEIYLWLRYNKNYSLDYEIFIGITIFTIAEIIIARAISSPYIFFSIGVIGNLYKNRNWTHRLDYN